MNVGIMVHRLLRSPSFYVFCLCGIVSVLLDIDHIPYALGLCPEGRPLHLLWGAAASIGGLWGLGILKNGDK